MTIMKELKVVLDGGVGQGGGREQAKKEGSRRWNVRSRFSISHVHIFLLTHNKDIY